MLIRHARQSDHSEWLRLRSALWPDCPLDDHHAEMAEQLADEKLFAVFVADRGNGQLAGFLEASLRRYAEGCRTSPVGYIEGWYVDDDVRRQGVGAQLVQAAEQWALDSRLSGNGLGLRDRQRRESSDHISPSATLRSSVRFTFGNL